MTTSTVLPPSMLALPPGVTDVEPDQCSHESFCPFAHPEAVKFTYRVIKSDEVSELTGPITPGSPAVVKVPTAPLMSIVMYTVGGFTVAPSAPAPTHETLFGTLVYGNPAFVRSTPHAVQSTRVYWIPQARRRIDGIRELRQNWDDEGGQRFSGRTISTARQVLEKFIAEAIRSDLEREPVIVPLPDGSIRFEWVVDERELFLTVSERHIEAQRWMPLSAQESIYFAEIDVSGVHSELEWLTA